MHHVQPPAELGRLVDDPLLQADRAPLRGLGRFELDRGDQVAVDLLPALDQQGHVQFGFPMPQPGSREAAEHPDQHPGANHQCNDPLRPIHLQLHAKPSPTDLQQPVDQERCGQHPEQGYRQRGVAGTPSHASPPAAEASQSLAELGESGHGRFTHLRPSHSPSINSTTHAKQSQVFQRGITWTAVSVLATSSISSGSLSTVTRS